MSLYDDESQANPEEGIDVKLAEMRQSAERTVKVLEENKAAISRWFFKALLALNLVLGSVWFWGRCAGTLLDFLHAPTGF